MFLSDVFDQIPAGHLRQLEIHDGKVEGSMSVQLFQRVGAGGYGLGGVSGLFESFSQDAQDLWIVVHSEDVNLLTFFFGIGILHGVPPGWILLG